MLPLLIQKKIMTLKRKYMFIGFLLFTVASRSQKPMIDSQALANWPSVMFEDASISDDGEYVSYGIENRPVGSRSLVIQSTVEGKKIEFAGASWKGFTGESDQAIVQRSDSLFIISLKSGKIAIVRNVNSFKQPGQDRSKWLAYKSNTSSELILLNLFTKKEVLYTNISDYEFSKDGRVLLLNSFDSQHSLTWVDLKSACSKVIWTERGPQINKITGYCFDPTGNQLVFNVTDTAGSNTIWHYKIDADSSTVIVSDSSTGIDSGMLVSQSDFNFNKTGKYLLFEIHSRKSAQIANPDLSKVDIWTYKDSLLQSAQTSPFYYSPNSFASIINLDDKKNISCGNAG